MMHSSEPERAVTFGWSSGELRGRRCSGGRETPGDTDPGLAAGADRWLLTWSWSHFSRELNQPPPDHAAAHQRHQIASKTDTLIILQLYHYYLTYY